MANNGWTSPEEAFRNINLDKYLEFEKQLREAPEFAPYMLPQKSTLCDLNAVRKNLGLPDWVPGKRNPVVTSQKVVKAWKRGSGAWLAPNDFSALVC
jgi:hypothetical protein